MSAAPKKTPREATDFEREQLRFLLTREDVAATLVEVNPSLAWLPMLTEMQLIKADTQLAPWVEKNFAGADAVRDVAANIHFFSPDTADILEFHLNRQAEALLPLLMKCWGLIIRHMRTAKRGALRNDWFDIEPRIKRGEQSPELLERLADTLRPKLKVGKRLSLYDEDNGAAPESPTDLMSIDYEIEDDITDEEVLSAWPENAAAEVDDKLLRLLTHALSAAVEDAIDVGVESNRGYGISDTDVPSVAKHSQNAYRTGFLPIVRVIAELWTRLARKDAALALPFVELWRTSAFRLVRRLSVFAAANAVVPPDMAAKVLTSLPQGELFLTSSSVEVYRLIHARWRDLPRGKREIIERRIAEGPPADWFREGAEIERTIDRCRFDLLGDLQRRGIKLSANAQVVLDDIRKSWPQWELRPQEQAGFHVWSGSSSGIVGDPGKLQDISDDDLVTEAKKAADEADFMEGDSWQALCQSDPQRALRGLEAQANKGEWPTWAWDPFLWAGQKIHDSDVVERIAQLLLEWPKDQFPEISSAASLWLNKKAKTLDEKLLWPLWDRIEETAPRDLEKADLNDAPTDSLNSPAGRLAEILIKKLTKGPEDREIPDGMRKRFGNLIDAPGTFGTLARVRLAAEVSFLFERAPNWTNEKIVPLFDWSFPDAPAAWSARKYSNYIGSSELCGLTKQPFLELFGRTDISDEELRVFSGWLTAIMLANQSGDADYPLTTTEAREALRQAGVRSLSSVGHRLAIEMKKAKPEEKISKWQSVVGPVFQSIWPLDIELQTSSSTLQLVQILRASGNAFPEATDVIIPFIRPEDPRRHTSVYSISKADDVLYSSSPERMLDLLAAVVGDAPARSGYGLANALDRVRACAPQLADTRKFQKLLSFASYG